MSHFVNSLCNLVILPGSPLAPFGPGNPTSITFTTVFCRNLIRESLQVQLGRTWLVQHKKSAEWSSTFIAPICELSLWAKSCSVTTRPHQNVLLKMKLHDLNCMKHRVMWWSDVVSCAGCACSCSTQDHECPVTVKTYYLCIEICNTSAGQR